MSHVTRGAALIVPDPMTTSTTSSDSILMRLVKTASSSDSGIFVPPSPPPARPVPPPPVAPAGPPGTVASDPPVKPVSPFRQAPPASQQIVRDLGRFIPRPPKSLIEAGLVESEVSALILKKLFHRPMEAGHKLSEQLGLKLPLIEPVLRQLKSERLVAYKSTAHAGDYVYELTDLGRDRGRELTQACTYYGTAPVPLQQYSASVAAQSIARQRPPLDSIRRAFQDLEIPERLLSNIGQAIHSGRGMFLFGNAGTERPASPSGLPSPTATTSGSRGHSPRREKSFACLIPTATKLSVSMSQWSMKPSTPAGSCIRRPTVIAGGELRMENLEVNYIRNTGIGEAPLQLKANCGMLLIDDFGRQRMPVDELLNRWIVPLEQRHDFLHLESGRTIQTPFDQLVVFSTNMEPKDLVEDAFLRRIPYKIEVKDPTESEFVKLFIESAAKCKFECTPDAVEYLLSKHYRPAGRSLRFCHPRDLLRQMENRCTLHELPRVVTPDALDQAVENYFSIM